MKKIYYIETTLNGYIIKKKPICDFKIGKDYYCELVFKLNGDEIEYYNDIAGDCDEIDRFLKNGNNKKCKEYENKLETKPNIYLEYWRTDSLGWYDDRYVGLMVDEEKKEEKQC